MISLNILLFVLVLYVNSATIRDLQETLFINYDPSSRPIQLQNETIKVCVGLFIVQIVGIQERYKQIHANIQLVFIWKDSFLKWNPIEYDNITAIIKKKYEIWTPDIIMLDSSEKTFHAIEEKDPLIRIMYDGQIRWQFQMFRKNFCELDLINFPFDEQTCHFILHSSSRNKEMLRLIRRNIKIKQREMIQTDWFVVDSSVEELNTTVLHDPLLEYSKIKFVLRLRRVVTYYFFKIVIPFTMIAMISLLTFWLPPESGEKLTLNVTILLSLIIYIQYLSEFVPRSVGTSELPILTIFTFSNFVLVFFSCSMTVFVLRIYHKAPTSRLPRLLRIIFFKVISRFVIFRVNLTKKSSIKIEYEEKNMETLLKNLSRVTNDQDKAKILLKILRQIKSNLHKLLLQLNRKTNERHQIYQEEWKYAALILDRLLFYLFSIFMTITLSVFLKIDFIDYLKQSKNDEYEANLC